MDDRGADAYRPIACDLYDRLEEAATLRRIVRIGYRDGKGEMAVTQGRIVDLRVSEGAEWMVLEDGFTLRLDRILALGDEPFGGTC